MAAQCLVGFCVSTSLGKFLRDCTSSAAVQLLDTYMSCLNKSWYASLRNLLRRAAAGRMRNTKLCNTAALCFGLHLQCYKYSFPLAAYERGDCIKACPEFLAEHVIGFPWGMLSSCIQPGLHMKRIKAISHWLTHEWLGCYLFKNSLKIVKQAEANGVYLWS